MLKLFQPYVSENASRYVTETLNSGQLAEGPKVKEFEKLFSKTFGWHEATVVSVNSGTSALELAYDLAGIKEGDEVIVPVLTCTATNVPLVRRGVKIVFADVYMDQLTIDIFDVQRKITSKTKAVVYVHFGGNNRHLVELKHICDEHGIQLIEDAAQALGSDLWGIGNHTAVSLQAIKTLTAGDGGIYIGDGYKEARKLRWFGYDRDLKQKLGDTDLELAGYKYHMNDINASIGLANLEEWDKIQEHKKKINQVYRHNGFYAHPWLVWGFTDKYEELKRKAEENGFEIGQHHYRNDKYTVFGGRQVLPVMDTIENRYFFVPSHMGVTEEDVYHISKVCQPYLI